MNLDKTFLQQLAEVLEEVAADARAVIHFEDSLNNGRKLMNQAIGSPPTDTEAANRPDPPTDTKQGLTRPTKPIKPAIGLDSSKDVAAEVDKKLAAVSTTPVESIPPKETDKIAMDLNHEVVKKMQEDEAKEEAEKNNIPPEVDVDEVEIVETGKTGGRPKSEELLAVERYANAGGDLTDVKKAAKVVHRQRPELDLKKLEQKVRDIRAARS